MTAESKKILIIDDETIIQDVLQRRFESMGFNVLKADDSEEGIRIIENEDIDLILCDLSLGDGFGTEVLNARASLRPNTPFVAMSGSLLTEAGQEELIRRGAALCLSKPFDSLREVTQRIAGIALRKDTT